MMEQIINSYYENNAEKLHKIVDKIFRKQHGGIIGKDMDEFYGAATDVFIDIITNNTYDPSKGSFEGYLYKAVSFKIISEMKKRTCGKRSSKITVTDKNGQTVLNKDGRPLRITIPDISIDAPVPGTENLTYGEILQSDFDIEEVLSESMNDVYDEKIEILMDSMTKTQRQMVKMKLRDVPVPEIKEKLGLSEREYSDLMKNIKSNKNWNLIKGRNRGGAEMSNKTAMAKADNIIAIETDGNVIPLEYKDKVIPLDVTDNYRTDKIPLENLIDDIDSNKINKKYILQREACQWSKEQVNKYLTRVLNGQPIPEIVICEQTVKGKKRSHLIDGLQRLTYSSLFMSDQIKIGIEGAEFYYLLFKDYLYDENGEIMTDEDGDARFKLKLFNVIGKKYSELPEYLKNRFKKYNVNVTTYFNCTDAQIAYHIRNYNNQQGMNKAQYEFTGMDIKIAEKIKKISKKHPFFQDCCGKYTNRNKIKGEVERIVVESIMTTSFLDNWKKETKDSFSYVNDNADDGMFDSLTDILDRLYRIIDKDTKSVFTTTNSSVWFAVFDKFRNLDIPDDRFKEFIQFVMKNMETLQIDNVPFINTYKSKNTRDKKIVTAKINGLTELMYEFFDIDRGAVNQDDIESFIAENVDIDIKLLHENMDFLYDILNGLEEKTVKKDSCLLEEKNKASLMAMAAYSFKNDVDLDEWMMEFSGKNDTYIRDQKQNYLYMLKDFETYIKDRKEDMKEE